MMLERIQKENDIKEFDIQEWDELAQEIRDFIIQKISKSGGHLASNLGVVELTMAMHLSFDLPKDKIIWDVGHQAYTHKILTGRQAGFDSLRKYGGMSGFPKRKESDCDAFDTGHSSTSISAGMGYVEAREITGENYSVISVIGDGALTGGMAYEALNNAATLKSNFIIVLNDNHMSISENVGGMSKYLDGIRTAQGYTEFKSGVESTLNRIPFGGEKIAKKLKKTKDSIKQLIVPGMFFEDMGITYLGPVDGHNIKELMKTFQEAKRVKGAVLIHVLTKKGKGYEPAELEPGRFHGPGPFEIETGNAVKKSDKDTYSDVFSKVIYDCGKKDDKLVAITAAMASGTGLELFQKKFPKRFFDVGIAEQHAVTFAAGLAAAGLKPVFAVYSSFLQRGYDQIIHDVCLQELPVVFAVDRAGLVGSDGETHQGIFDLSFLSMAPGITILSPKNKWEMADMVRFATTFDGPIALRYPRGTAYEGNRENREPIELGKAEVIEREDTIAILSFGHMFENSKKAYELLKEEGYRCSLINMRFIKPLDESLLSKLSEDHQLFVTVEENVLIGGAGEAVLNLVNQKKLNVTVANIGIPDEYVEHGNVEILRQEVFLDAKSIQERIVKEYKDVVEKR